MRTPGGQHGAPRHADFYATLAQIAIIDIVFSLDSVITAVGMVERHPGHGARHRHRRRHHDVRGRRSAISSTRHPTIKMLALSFLILVGVALIGEGIELHIPKGYIYFAMAFSVVRRDAEPAPAQGTARRCSLHKELAADDAGGEAPPR